MTAKDDILRSSAVAISTGHDGYPSEPPYSPSAAYPEYPFGPDTRAKEINHAYEGVRESLWLLELDAEHYGRGNWNPLREIVRLGDTVVLKPNFVRDFRETRPGHENCLITHGSIIRAILDYVYIALKGEGRIIIADAPQNDADFNEIRRIAGLDEIQEFYHHHANVDVEIYDLRLKKGRMVDDIIIGYDKLPGDPAGYVKVDLGQHSTFCEVSHLCHLLYGAEYDTSELRSHHHDDVHEYLIAKTIMEADCVINLPKLKTHKKTGITICLKNLVGINGNKNWLPHHRLGTPAQGGDQFADDGMKHRIERRAMACFRGVFPFLGPMRKSVGKTLRTLGKGIFGDTNIDTIRSGNWYGNDTTWRMVLDLNRILMYADKDGHLQDSPARRLFCIVDGIVSGEGNGPLDPIPKSAGVVVVGKNPVTVELACARLMGFDFMRLPVLRRAFDNHSLPLAAFEYDDVICRSNAGQFDRPLNEFDGTISAFQPHFGWQGYIEISRSQVFEAPRDPNTK
jgi:uncharacterized protein (DUF362 family)